MSTNPADLSAGTPAGNPAELSAGNPADFSAGTPARNPARNPAELSAELSAGLPLTFDLDRAWDLHPRVEIRPERFGALLYSFDTRRLSFLRSRELLAVVQALATAPTARDACAAVGIPSDQLPTYRAALARLAETAMITPRESD